MTNPDQLRAAFEAWARRGGWSMKLWPSGLAEYISTATEAAWQGYIAGHAAALAAHHSPDAGRASPTCKESLPVDADGVPDTSGGKAE